MVATEECVAHLVDKVMAFALTLLVLQVKVPPLAQVADPASPAERATQTSQLVSYAIVFYIITQFGLTHTPGSPPRDRQQDLGVLAARPSS